MASLVTNKTKDVIVDYVLILTILDVFVVFVIKKIVVRILRFQTNRYIEK